MDEFRPAEAVAFDDYDDDLMPIGYGEGDDIFDPDSWSGSAADASTGTEQAGETGADDFGDVGLTMDDAVKDEGTVEEQPTTLEPETNPANKLRFKANIDHSERDVELDESELPVIYQKAQALDRAQAKLTKMSPVAVQAERLAKLLGYEDASEMLKTTEENFQNGEIDKLRNEGVHPEVAKDLVARRMTEASIKDAEDEINAAPQARDFKAEVSSLLEAHPELKGKSLPNEVVSECVKTGEPLLSVYQKYVANREKAELSNLRRENSTLRQNADAASRAPVRGTTKGGATDTSPEDPFLKGFMEDDW